MSFIKVARVLSVGFAGSALALSISLAALATSATTYNTDDRDPQNGNGAECPVGSELQQHANQAAFDHALAESQQDGTFVQHPNTGRAASLGFCKLTNTNRQDQQQDQEQRAEAAAKAFSGSSSAVQSAIRGGDQELAAELVSNHLQSIGFSPDVSNQVATSVVTQLAQTQDNDQTQGDDGINLDQSDHSNRRSVTFGSQQSVQLVAPPVGNYTCALRVGEANSNTSAPAAARSRVTNIGVAGDVGNGGGAGQVTLGLGSSSIDGINQDQGIALLTPCAEAQQTLTGVLRSVVSVDQLIVRPAGNNITTINSLGQQQQQLQGTTGRQNTPVRARQ